MSLWVRVAGFKDQKDYHAFVERVEFAIAEGHAEEVEVDPDYSRASIYGGRWFVDTVGSTFWRLVPPQSPFMGLWEQLQLGEAAPRPQRLIRPQVLVGSPEQASSQANGSSPSPAHTQAQARSQSNGSSPLPTNSQAQNPSQANGS